MRFDCRALGCICIALTLRHTDHYLPITICPALGFFICNALGFYIMICHALGCICLALGSIYHRNDQPHEQDVNQDDDEERPTHHFENKGKLRELGFICPAQGFICLEVGCCICLALGFFICLALGFFPCPPCPVNGVICNAIGFFICLAIGFIFHAIGLVGRNEKQPIPEVGFKHSKHSYAKLLSWCPAFTLCSRCPPRQGERQCCI